MLAKFVRDGKHSRVVGGAALVLALVAAPRMLRILLRRGRLWHLFFKAELRAWDRDHSFWPPWARWRNLNHLLWIENTRQLNIEAVGADVARSDPSKLFAHGVLAHVKTQAGIASQKEKQAKAQAAAGVPHVKHLVLIGGGHAHAHILRMSGMEPIAGLRITLITRDVLTPYSGMIPGHVAGRYSREECHLDLLQLGAFAKIRVIVDVAVGLELEKKKVKLESGREISYDYLAIDVGVSPQIFGQSGYVAQERTDVTTVKPIDRFTYRLDKMFAKVPHWTKPNTIVVVGAGIGGTELSLVVQHRYQLLLEECGKPRDMVRVILIGNHERVTPGSSVAVSEELHQALSERGIETRLGQGVKNIKDGTITLEDGSQIAYDEVLWNTDGVPHEWLQMSGLTVNEKGFVVTDTTLRSVSHPEVFATGDCGAIENYPRAKAGVFAVLAGHTLWRNVNHLANSRPLEHYIPQSEHLGLINLGDGRAIASRGVLCVAPSEWLFELKDWIDRKWMYNYQKEGLPAMETKAVIPGMAAQEQDTVDMLKASTMRCGGCGSKVGSTILSQALSRLEHRGVEHPDVKLSVGEDCAVIERTPGGTVTVSSVDFFKAGYLARDLQLLGRIAAQHALSDVWAMGAVPVHAMAMCTVPLATDNLMEDDITEMLTGATRAFKENGCQLSGGHTTEGELALGFSVEGTAPSLRALWAKGGMRAGHDLFLTKPIGTGALQAGIMRHRVAGPDVEAMLAVMATSNRAAAEALSKSSPDGFTMGVGVTDVTGFGLMGHLAEMCKESNARAEICVSKVPLMDGVIDVINEGIFSTLQSSNVRVRRAVDTSKSDSATMQLSEYAVLYDPQTSGGLLISIPPAIGVNFLKLYPSARKIGRVIEGAWSNLGSIVIRP